MSEDYPRQDVLLKGSEWLHDGGGVQTCSDGRLAVIDMPDILILPAPAAKIWKSARARKVIQELNDIEHYRSDPSGLR